MVRVLAGFTEIVVPSSAESARKIFTFTTGIRSAEVLQATGMAVRDSLLL